MRVRFLLIGTVVGTVVLYAWQTASNVAIPWHAATMRAFANNGAAVQAIHGAAPENGVYFAPEGALVVVAFTPDLADKSKAMGPMLVNQAGIDLVVVFLLALVVLGLPSGAVSTALTLGLVGGAASVVTQLSDWNWYGFAAPYALVNVADLVIGFALAGLVLGAIAQRTLHHGNVLGGR